MAPTRGARDSFTLEECIIEATVPTGFETIAAEEAEELFQTQCKSTRGKITFQATIERVKDVLKLGCIDHCRVQVLHVPSFAFTSDAEDCLSRLQLLVQDVQWRQGLEVWGKFCPFQHSVCPLPDSVPRDQDLVNVSYSAHMPATHTSIFRNSGKCSVDSSDTVTERNEHIMSNRQKRKYTKQRNLNHPSRTVDSTDTLTEMNAHITSNRENRKYTAQKNPEDSPRTKPRFRVTCNRTGENHCFDSMSAAASFGSAVQAYFGWQVDLRNFDVEIMLHIDNDEVSVSIALTPDSLHRRDLVTFGVTTLRPTIACNMLRMVGIQPGHTVCDPLCGTSSIAIQGALRFPALQLSGDSHRVAMEKTRHNIDAVNTRQAAYDRGGLVIDAVRWNACYLPLRNGIVDAFVSDLPFGKRVGRRSENLKLYSGVLREMARCGTPTARAALLTGDLNNMTKALRAQRYWSQLRRYGCNIGGIAAAVFLLHRTALSYGL